ncbi:M91 family zinc metallopeptidase [Citrobacter portucalensis]|uniref:M91 family zinc metallopeptidase n=1 Tax=Citrobacter portucalensis TaxID=1639133 RepID=UPI003CEA3F24
MQSSTSQHSNLWINRQEKDNKTVEDAIGHSVEVRESKVAPRILIEEEHHRSGFYNVVESALSKIADGPSGRKLINKIHENSTSDKLMLLSFTRELPYTTAFLTPIQKKKYSSVTGSLERSQKAMQLAEKRFHFFKGEVNSAQIMFHPDIGIDVDAPGYPKINHVENNTTYLTLTHEMIHGMRILKGTSIAPTGGDEPNSGRMREEHRIVGIGKRRSPSKNTIRAEHGEPLRLFYRPRMEVRNVSHTD